MIKQMKSVVEPLCSSTCRCSVSILLIVCVGCVSAVEAGESGKETELAEAQLRAKVERLVAQLGADEFASRDAADKQLRALGDRLLFQPGLESDEDLGSLGRFHRSFVVPLYHARKSDDAELRRRASDLFREFSPGYLIGDGPDGWALYAVHRLLPELPRLLDHGEYFRKYGKPRPRMTSDEDRLEGFRRNLRRDIERLTLIKRSHEDPKDMAESILEGRYRSFDPAVHLASVASVWADDDFDAALKYFSELHKAEPYGVSKLALSRLIAAWPEDRPLDTALQWIVNCQDKGKYIWWPDLEVYDIAKRYARENPEKAFAWAESIASAKIRGGMIVTVIRAVSESNSKLANELVSRIEDRQVQQHAHVAALLCLVERGEKVDDATIDAISRPRSRDTLRSAMVRVMAKTDPEAAIKVADTILRPVSKKNSYSDIAELWGSRDDAATLKWISTVEDKSTRGWCMEGLVQGLSIKDLSRAIELAETLRGSTTHLFATGYLVRELAKSNPLAALQLLQKTDHPEGALSLPKGRVAAIWAQHDPAKAAKWVAEQQDEVLAVTWNREVAKVWASTSASGAARWAASLPSSEARIFAFVGIVEVLLPSADVTDRIGHVMYAGERK